MDEWILVVQKSGAPEVDAQREREKGDRERERVREKGG